ncbi:Uncharacterized protein Rs2_18474 [Raphanus sativus]|nr:Uncharacterized protein Rs2_18474 [Raphanus sativus]
MPHMHYGQVGTQGYIRKQYCDAEGNWVLPMFPEPEKQYRELPFGYPHEQTVGRKVIMPHFQRMAMEKRILQGHATFQLASEGEFPRKRGRRARRRVQQGSPRGRSPGSVNVGHCSRILRENDQLWNTQRTSLTKPSYASPRMQKCGASGTRTGFMGTLKISWRVF